MQAQDPATRRAHELVQEALLVVGGGRAILLQIADPAIAAGVARHSDFANRAAQRLRNTLSYCYAVGGGTPEDAALARRLVDRAHGPVRSEPGQAPAFDAFDPRLQLWVAATLYDSAVAVHEAVFGPLPPQDADAVLRAFAPLGTALQMPAELWPADRAAFERYRAERVARLQVTDAARSVAADLLHPRRLPLWLRAFLPLGRLITAGLLDPALREAYGLPWDERRQRRLERVLALTRVVYPRLPRSLRRLPRTILLRRLRRHRARLRGDDRLFRAGRRGSAES